MTLFETIRPNCIALYASKQEACSAEVGAPARVFEKSTTKPNFLRFKCASAHGHVSIGRHEGTYTHRLGVDTGCSLEDRPEAID